MKNKLLIALMALVAVSGALWAADQTWLYPVPTLAGLNTGDLLVAANANNLTNHSRIRILNATPPTCPTYNQCGTGYTISGNDSSGIVTFGSVLAAQTTVELVFNAVWTAAPSCIGQRRTGTAGSVVQAARTSTTDVTFTIATGMATSDTMSYHCMGTT